MKPTITLGPTSHILCTAFFFFLLFNDIPAFSQQSKRLDSLLQELKKPERDTNRANLLALVAKCLYTSEAEKAKSFAIEALGLSSELSFTKGLAIANKVLGNIYQSGELDSALYHYLESLNHYQTLNDSLNCIEACYNIANVYLQLSNFEAAKKYQLLCCELADQVNNHEHSFLAKNGMGMYYVGLGWHHEDNKDTLSALESYKEAIPFLTEAVQHADSAGIEFYKFQAYGNLAYIKAALEDYDEALSYALQTLKSYEDRGMVNYYPISYTQIADIYLRMGNYKQAITYATTSLKWSKDADNLYAMKESNQILYKAYKGNGKYKEALDFGQRVFELSKQLLNKEREEQVAQMQTKFDTDQLNKENELLKKEAEIAKINIKKQQVMIRFAAGLLLLIITITLLIYKNLIDKKRFATKIQSLQSTQTRWFTNIAHELRTPLTLILGPVKQIIDQQVPNESLMSELGLVEKNGEQLVRRVNEILDISRMESGKLTVTQQPEDLAPIVEQAIGSFASLARQKEVSMQFSYNTSLILNIDQGKVSTILNNLLSNAIKFTPSGGTVSVDWHYGPEKSPTLDIRIADTGIGIPEKDLPYIFDRFYQANNQPQSGGSGVGLALTRELARLHGGDITVSSQENQGTTFTFSLPKSLIEEAGPSSFVQSYKAENESKTALEVTQANENTDKPCILLVEDHPDMRHYISKLLKDRYQVIEAVDGQKALDTLSEFTPDLIISDVMMPVMDGLAFAKKVKEDPKHRLTPFITLTAHANERDRLTAYRTGVDDYIVKPFNAQELLVRVQNLLTNAIERKKAVEEALASPEEELVPPTHEEKLLVELEQLVHNHLSDSSFSIASLTTHAAMSESSLNRFLKKKTGLTPGQYIRDIRLQEAIYLLESHQYKTISEVVYAVGFEDTSSFSRLFKARFGKSPSAHMKEAGSV